MKKMMAQLLNFIIKLHWCWKKSENATYPDFFVVETYFMLQLKHMYIDNIDYLRKK